VVEYCANAATTAAGQFVALRDVTAEVPRPAAPATRDPKHVAAADLRPRDREPGALLEHAAGRVGSALAADLVGVFERRGRRLLLRAGLGWDAKAVGHATVSGAPGAAVGRALAGGEPVIIADLRGIRAPARASRLLVDHDVISGIETAIDGAPSAWGVLGAYVRRPRGFTPDELDFLCVAADSLGLALRCAERERAISEACRATERRAHAEITQLLHDDALQSMLAVRQHLAFAVQRPDRRDAVVRARDGVQRAIRELRDAVSGLHPVALEARRLREAVQVVVAHEAVRGGFEADVRLAVQPSQDCAPLVLSLIRELMANAAEHASARAVSVVLGSEEADLVLEVGDDGVGIAPGRLEVALAEGHIGLASAMRRVRALGGDLTIASPPHGGTVVRVVLPLAQAETVQTPARSRRSD